MKGKYVLTMAFALVVLLTLSLGVSALPDVDYVKIDGDIHESGDTLVVERGDDLTIKVKLQADNTTEKDIIVEADILGYEYSDRDGKLSDSTHVFDMDAGDTRIETLDLTVPVKADRDFYDLRVRIGGRTGPSHEETYRLRIEGQRHSLEIRDVILHPSTVEAGSSLLANVRVTNRGEKEEDDVKVIARIPALNLEDSDYINELEEEESRTSEELFMRIPACADAGQYEVEIIVEFDEGYEEVTASEMVTVVEGRLCDENKEDDGRTIVSVGSQAQQVTAGQGGATYSLAITNTGSSDKTYTVGVSGVSAWGTYRVDPSTTMVVKSGETKPVFVFVSANEDTNAGQQSFVATVSSGSDSEAVQFNANVVEGNNNVRKWAEFVLIALVVLLVILGLIIGFSRMKARDDDEDEELSGQTYY